ITSADWISTRTTAESRLRTSPATGPALTRVRSIVLFPVAGAPRGHGLRKTLPGVGNPRNTWRAADPRPGRLASIGCRNRAKISPVRGTFESRPGSCYGEHGP